MGTEFLFGVRKKFWKSWWWLHNIVNVIHLKLVEMANFMLYVFYHNLKKLLM